MKKNILFISAVTLCFCACGNRNTSYDASGVFEATEVIVSAKATGELLSFQVEEGQEVDASSPLGVIDTLQLSLKRQQVMATLSATDSRRLDETRQLASLRQQIANLQREKKRYSELLKDNAATQKQVDEIGYQIDVLQRQLTATSEQIGSNNSSLAGQSSGILAQLAQIEDQIKNSVITSPIRGTVLTKYMEQGEYALPGKALFKVADIGDMKLRAYITASQLTTLQLGQSVTVYADQGQSERKAYQGKVTWISDKAEFTPKTIQTRDERANLVYAIKVAVKNDGMIKKGMYGDVKF